MDKAYKYHLEPYKGMATRHRCPGCGDCHSFTFYVDEEGNPLDEEVGRCDHESGCGYHLTPSQYLAEHPEHRANTESRGPFPIRRAYAPLQRPKTAPTAIDTIPFEYVEQSVSYRSAFIAFLCKMFEVDDIRRVVERYALGATKAGDVIYWQIDSSGRVRGGKIIKYDAESGHRIKEGAGHVDWIHSRMKKAGTLPDSWSLNQCLFGEHLLRWPGTESQTIALVESEKSAIIGAAAFPQYLWMATGGIGNLNAERMAALKGRTIIIFPDIDGTAKWEAKASAIRGCKVIVSHLLEEHATPEERAAKIDVADWIISCLLDGSHKPRDGNNAPSKPIIPTDTIAPRWNAEGIPHMEHQPTQEEGAIVASMRRHNPALSRLIDGLGMVVTSIKHIETDEEWMRTVTPAPIPCY